MRSQKWWVGYDIIKLLLSSKCKEHDEEKTNTKDTKLVGL